MNIFITGTSSGIGFGLSKEYLDSGHKVFGISRNYNETLSQYSNFYFLSLDLTDFEVVEEEIPIFLKKIDTLDVVVLNAGKLNKVQDLKDTGLKELKDVMDINLWANKILIDNIFHHVERVLQVVAISSGASVSGSRGWNGYALSKAALNMMIKLYAKEFPGTHFSALAPGIIDTNMQEYIATLSGDTRFPVVEKLQKARGTSQMPKPNEAAPLLIDAFKRLKNFESGSFQDVRKM